MRSRERLLRALDGETPDRVPVTLFIQDEGHFLKQMHPELNIMHYQENKKLNIDLQRELGVDIHLRMFNGCIPLWLQTGGLNTDRSTDQWQVELEKRRDNGSILLEAQIRTPDGELSQEFSISRVNEGTYHYACTRKPIQSMHDLELVKAYEPSVTEEYEQHIHQLVQNTRDYLGDDGIISLWAPGGAFNHASRLVNIEELYMLYLVDPEFYQELMRFCIERTHPWLEVMLSTDIDVLNIGGNVAGGFLGRENFERYIMGYEQEFIANLKATGKKINYHNCGSIMELLDSYKKLGMDIVEPVAPPPLGDGDLEEAVRIANGAYTLIGNIDQVNVIQKGTPGQIHKKVKEALAIGRDYPGFILQPADFLEYGTPRENVEAYVEAGLQQSSL